MTAKSILPSEPLRQVYRLMWQPGQSLHADWWQHLNMMPQMRLYPNLPQHAQRQIDRQIVAMRPQGDGTPTSLTDVQLVLLHLQPRLEMYLSALGLQLLGCRGYLWLREYRQALCSRFSQQQIKQLAVLMPEGAVPVAIPAAVILQAALQKGIDALHDRLPGDRVWQALTWTLPRLLPINVDPVAAFDLPSALLRLERFL